MCAEPNAGVREHGARHGAAVPDVSLHGARPGRRVSPRRGKTSFSCKTSFSGKTSFSYLKSFYRGKTSLSYFKIILAGTV